MSGLTQRTSQLADQLQTVNQEVATTIQECTNEQWQQQTASETWPVAVVAHHIAMIQGNGARLMEMLAAGAETLPGFSAEDVEQMNAEHAQAFADVSKEDTLNDLQVNGGALARNIRKLNDEQLDRQAGTFAGYDMTVAQFIELAMIAHIQQHLGSIRETIAA